MLPEGCFCARLDESLISFVWRMSFKHYKYLDILTVLFVTVLLLSNLVTHNKVCRLGNYVFTSGIILFPLSYLLGDVLTEVYGYARSRRIIWIGFWSLIFSTTIVQIILLMPPADGWYNQRAYETVLGNVPRTVISSIIAFWAGEFTNSFVIAKMKIFTKGKYLFTRTIGSTVCGEAVDTLIFYPLAFYGLPSFPLELILKIMITNYTLKVLWEVFATPITYKVVEFLKKKENEDYYDYKTDFSPFHVDA